MRLLEAAGLNKRFGGVWALRALDVHQEDTEVLGMIGPNGSGKTSFINAVTGHLRLDAGSVRFNGEEIAGRTPHALAHAGLLRTYQSVRVYGRLPVADNLRIARLPHFSRLGHEHPLQDIEQIVDWLHLRHRWEVPAGTLTLFEQRRLELAMRLVSRPRLIMLDEPVGGLAPSEIQEMIALLAEVRRVCALFVIEHTMRVIQELADRVVVLVAGEKIADGTAAEILKDERVIANYLGAVRA